MRIPAWLRNGAALVLPASLGLMLSGTPYAWVLNSWSSLGLERFDTAASVAAVYSVALLTCAVLGFLPAGVLTELLATRRWRLRCLVGMLCLSAAWMVLTSGPEAPRLSRDLMQAGVSRLSAVSVWFVPQVLGIGLGGTLGGLLACRAQGAQERRRNGLVAIVAGILGSAFIDIMWSLPSSPDAWMGASAERVWMEFISAAWIAVAFALVGLLAGRYLRSDVRATYLILAAAAAMTWLAVTGWQPRYFGPDPAVTTSSAGVGVGLIGGAWLGALVARWLTTGSGRSTAAGECVGGDRGEQCGGGDGED